MHCPEVCSSLIDTSGGAILIPTFTWTFKSRIIVKAGLWAPLVCLH